MLLYTVGRRIVLQVIKIQSQQSILSRARRITSGKSTGQYELRK